MPIAIITLRFLFGLACGSFLNVVALRYEPERFLFALRGLRGRSRCDACARPLRRFELIPLVSFFLSRGRCRTCRARLSLQYPIVEFLAGAVVAVFPYFFSGLSLAIWIAVGFLGILIAAIDVRLMLIPDEASIALAALGVFLAAFGQTASGLGHYALLVPWSEPTPGNRLLAACVALLFFGAVIFVSRGRGMGLGDLKLAGALGLLLGWPDILFSFLLAFVIGALVSFVLLARGLKGLKGSIPFGPFLIAGAFLTRVFGVTIMDGYFSFFTWLYEG